MVPRPVDTYSIQKRRIPHRWRGIRCDGRRRCNRHRPSGWLATQRVVPVETATRTVRMDQPMAQLQQAQFVATPRSTTDMADPHITRPMSERMIDSYETGSVAGWSAKSAPSFGRTGRCAYQPCNRTLPVQPGPGRPRRFCSSTCRRLAGKQARTAVQAPARRPRPPLGSFSTRLRASIADRGLKLASIARRLHEEDGIDVSPSTLSNWQNGRPPRRTPEDDERIYA